MKRFFLFLICCIVATSIKGQSTDFRYSGCMSYKLTNPHINKKECWELIKLWVVSDMDEKGAYIAYENWDSGTILIKGEYRYTADYYSLYLIRNNILEPHISYEIEINCEDGKYSFTVKDIKFASILHNFNPYSLSEFEMERCLNELREIKDIMMVKGNKWNVNDNYFQNREDELDRLSSEAKNKMNDESITKKQRALYKKQWMEYSAKSSVHHTVMMSVGDLFHDAMKINASIYQKYPQHESTVGK